MALALSGLFAGVCAPAGADEAYRAEIQEWRDAREAGLEAEDGWLSLVGLFWLKEGPNRFGSDPSSDMVLPMGSSPESAGVFTFEDGRTTLKLERGVDGRIDGERVTGPRVMQPDTADRTDILEVGNVTMYVIERGDRFGIRAKDKTSPVRTGFTGLNWYPIDEGYRIEARWVSYPSPRPLKVPNVLGETEIRPSPGHAEFELDGQLVRLDGVLQDSGSMELFFILRDQTSGKETYGSGRFLYADPPKQGRVILDFNKSYNPPCAFTPYATCPLPPKQNWLPVKVEAGEQAYGAAHH
jgi:uncharacterized protein (DUF1684 family)